MLSFLMITSGMNCFKLQQRTTSQNSSRKLSRRESGRSQFDKGLHNLKHLRNMLRLRFDATLSKMQTQECEKSRQNLEEFQGLSLKSKNSQVNLIVKKMAKSNLKPKSRRKIVSSKFSSTRDSPSQYILALNKNYHTHEEVHLSSQLKRK